MDNRDKFNRRELLKRGVAFGAVVAGSGALLSACGNDSSGGGGGGGGDLSCNDVSGLSEADKATRTSMQYVDSTPQPDKTCDNCQLYTVGQANACGTCTVVKGPIHPKAGCTSWAEKVRT